MLATILTTTTGLENLGTVWTQITTWIQNIVQTITSSPILLVGLGIFVVGRPYVVPTVNRGVSVKPTDYIYGNTESQKINLVCNA